MKALRCGIGAHRLVEHRRLRLDQHLVLVVGDAGDQVGIDAVAAVGEHRVGGRHLHRRDRAGAQRHRQVGRMLFALEAEIADPFLAVARADRLQDADRHHVLGLHERAPHRHRALEAAVVVLGLPGLAAGGAGVEEQRGVVDHGGGREALFERGRVDEGLEARARLAPRLRDVVELVLAEVEAAHHGLDGAVARIQGDEGTFDLGQLGDLPGVLGRARDADHGAAADLDVGRRLVRQARLRRTETFAGDLEHVAVGAHRLIFLGLALSTTAAITSPLSGMVGQRVVDRVVDFLRVVRQVDELLGAAVDLRRS
jgi:hypothetical protein